MCKQRNLIFPFRLSQYNDNKLLKYIPHIPHSIYLISDKFVKSKATILTHYIGAFIIKMFITFVLM